MTFMSVKTIPHEIVRDKISSSIFSDVLDGMGFRHQTMREWMRPLYPGAVIVGCAHTMLMAEVQDPEEDTFPLQIEGIDRLKKDDVMVVASNRSIEAALWGELLSTAARCRGARGAVIDGLTRDTKQIEEMKFPVFAAGARPSSSKGRCKAIDYGHRISCGGVSVEPGDLIFGDVDGIVVVPRDLADEAVRRGIDRANSENFTRKELVAGALLKQVYEKYGTL